MATDNLNENLELFNQKVNERIAIYKKSSASDNPVEAIGDFVQEHPVASLIMVSLISLATGYCVSRATAKK